MAKLSQQIPQKTPYYTRTERLKVRQAQRREGINQQQFEELQRQAEQLQQTEFSNITSVEEYEQKYNRLSPALRQFFVAPSQLKEQQSATISTTKTNLQKEIAEAQKKKSEVYSVYQKKIAEAQADWNIQSTSYRQDPRNRERYQAKIERLNNAIEEKEAFYDEYIRRLNEGYNEVSAGKNLSYSSVVEYATEYGSYKEDQKRAKNEQTAYAQKQLKKIEELQSQGYSPFVIEQKSATGKTEKVSVELYSAEKGDYQTIYTYTPIQDVSKLQKSSLGSAVVPLTFDIGKQKVTYSATTGLYKDEGGKLYTPYGAVGKTEAELVREVAVKSGLPEDIEMPKTKKTFVEKAGEKIILPFVDKLTLKQKAGLVGISKQAKSVKEFYDNLLDTLPDTPMYINLDPIGSTTGIFSPIKTSKWSYSVEELKEKGAVGLDKVTEKAIFWSAGGEEEIEKISERESMKEVSEEYQLRFEDKYMEKLLLGETDFETASKEFEESEVGKQLQKKYDLTYKSEYAKLTDQQENWFKKWGGMGAVGGLQFTKGILGFVPETARQTVVRGGLAYGGYSLLKLKVIPLRYIYGAVTYTGYRGFKFALDPTKTIEERGAGLFSGVLSASLLGYGAYRYARSPVTTRAKTKVPKASLKTQAVGKEAMRYAVKYEGQVGKLEKVTFGKQKLSQQVTAGYRTIVTTKGRVLLNKYLNYQMTGVKVKNLYEGVPYADPKGYAKSFGRLKSYGYTPTQARAKLRYSAPRVIDVKLLSGEILASPSKAVGKFTYETTKPIYEVDKRLGIKTRGGKAITDVYRIDRTLTQETAIINKQVAPYDVVTQTIIRTRTPAPLGKAVTRFVQKGVVDASKVSDSYFRFNIKDIQRGITYTSKLPYQQQFLTEIYAQKQVLPLKRKITTGIGRTQIIKSDIPTKEVDLDKLVAQMRGFKVTKIPVTKPATPVRTIEQMSSTELKQMIKDVKGIYKPTRLQTESAKQMKAYLKSLTPPKPVTQTPATSQQLISQLKSAYVPPEIATPVKSAIIQKELIYMGTGQKVLSASVLGVRARSDLKSDLALKSLLRQNIQIKLDQGFVLGLKGRQDLALRQAPALQSALKLDTTLTAGFNIPRLTTPYTSKPTTFPPFLFDLDLKEKLRKKQKERKKSIWELGLLPDFTAKAIGLKSPEIPIKDVEKQLLRVQTGIDVRRGGRVKW